MACPRGEARRHHDSQHSRYVFGTFKAHWWNPHCSRATIYHSSCVAALVDQGKGDFLALLQALKAKKGGKFAMPPPPPADTGLPAVSGADPGATDAADAAAPDTGIAAPDTGDVAAPETGAAAAPDENPLPALVPPVVADAAPAMLPAQPLVPKPLKKPLKKPPTVRKAKPAVPQP